MSEIYLYTTKFVYHSYKFTIIINNYTFIFNAIYLKILSIYLVSDTVLYNYVFSWYVKLLGTIYCFLLHQSPYIHHFFHEIVFARY